MSREIDTRILACCGSIRSRASNNALIADTAAQAANLDHYLELLKQLPDSPNRFCNTEILAGAALVGASSLGCEVEYFSIKGLFPTRDQNLFDLKQNGEFEQMSLLDTLEVDRDRLESLLEKITASQGLVLSTPVYFGDRSSVANKLLQITGMRSSLKSKAFGVTSVGAKRNGGQETTNIFCLNEALFQHALGVGNGPPTSQYGGTAVAGDRGAVLEDYWGLLSAFGTGQRVGHVSQLIKAGQNSATPQRVMVTILVTMDTSDGLLSRYIGEITYLVSQEMPWVEFKVINLINSTIYRCLGCSTCPVPAKSGDEGDANARPRCVVKERDDILESLRLLLNQSDGLLLAGLNLLRPDQIIYRYQVFLERTRFIRRNNFELTNLVVGGLAYHQLGAKVNLLHSLKSTTSFLRHNTILHRSVEVFENNGEVIYTGVEDLKKFCHSVGVIKAGREMVASLDTPYMRDSFGGYKDKEGSRK